MRYFSKKSFTMRQVVGLLTIVFLGIAAIAYAVTVDFTPGSTISSTAVENAINQNRSVSTCSIEGSIPDLATVAPFTNVQSVSITVPGPGTIIVSGSGYFSLSRAGAVSWFSGVSISDTSEVINQAARSFWGGPAGMPAGTYYVPFHQEYAFTVAGAGTYTYYLVGWKNTADTLGASESKICAVFAPN